MSETVPTPEILLEHQGWLRSLAGRLVHDPATADDAVQETLAAAIAHGRPVRHMRGWLATVLRNRVRDGVRRDRRREARDRASATPEASFESPVDVVERAELAQNMTAAVLGLDEPFRSTVLLRYFDGLSNEEIARRHEVPAATVRTRLKRALDRLRERFDAEHDGDRTRWTGAMALAFGVEPAGVAATGGAAATGGSSTSTASTSSSLSWSAAVAIVAVIAVVTGVVVYQLRPGWFGVESTSDRVAGIGASDDPDRARVLTPAADPAGPGAARAGGGLVAAAPSGGDHGSGAPADAPAAEPLTVELTGRVIDVGGEPLAGIELVVDSSWASNLNVPLGPIDAHPPIVSRADGRFAATLAGIDPRVTLLVSAREPQWETIGTATVNPHAPGEALVIAGEVTVVAGHVFDAAREPVVGVAVQLELGAWRRNAALDPSQTKLEILHTTTNDHGEFVFDRVPDGVGRSVTAHAGDRARGVDIGPGDVLGLEIEFDPNRDRTKIGGFVVDERGFAVEGAVVVHGHATTRSDRDGRFVLSIPIEPDEEDRLLAVADGYWPTVPSAWDRTAPIELRLTQRSSELVGTLAAPAGDAVEDYEIVLLDPTPVGGWKTLEEWAAKRRQFLVQPDGSFRVNGLGDRPYTLRFRNRMTYLEFDAGPFTPGGAPLEILPPEEPYRTVRGVVVGLDGAPLAGVEVHRAVEYQTPDGDQVTTYLDADVSDAKGRFEVKRVTRAATIIQLEGATIVPVLLDLPANDTQIEYVVARRCGLRVTDAGPRDQIELLDANDEPLTLHVISAGSRTSAQRFGARQGVITVPETGVRLRFLRNGEEIETVEVTLTPGEVTAVAAPQ